MNPALADKVGALARTPVLLVASDFDGTLADLASEPRLAAPLGESMDAMRALASLAHTHVAVVSGRGLDDLRRVSGLTDPVTLVGSHGAEMPGWGRPAAPDPALLEALAATLSPIAADTPGSLLERKPWGVALHYRGAPLALGAAAVERAMSAVMTIPALAGVTARRGSMVVEFSLSGATKGGALEALWHRSGATAVFFAGDDPTDEDGMRALATSDLGVKVGEGPTAAGERVGTPRELAAVLAELLARRRAWLSQRNLVPLERHSVLSDQRTLAVVDPAGSVVWLCAPRVDSSSVFAALVGGENAGHWSVTAGGAGPATQRYEPDSMVLVTDFGGVRVTDYLDCAGGRAFQRAGRSDLVRVLEGRGDAVVRFAPRLDFGRSPTRLIPHEHGLIVEGSSEPLALYAPGIAWSVADEGRHQTATARLTLADAPVFMELRVGTAAHRPPTQPEPDRRRENVRFWSGWASSLRLPALHAPVVKRGAIMLKALCHGPTGAIVAAATTSLPEHLGGVRNWDYRFCWPRDAAIAAGALVRLGNHGHALKLLDWVLGIIDAAESPDRLRPIYTVTGRHLPPEADISHLCGYGDSRPVRISNAAATQVQLDVFGPIVDLMAMIAERGAPLSPEHWRLAQAMVGAVEARWREPDHGIWEFRTERRHHVHSKVMCWHTVRRGLAIEEALHGRANPAWAALAEEIRADVLAHGWSPELRSFRGAYGRETMDAAALWVGLSGLLPPDDERVVATVDAANARLRRGPTVYRYFEEDGLPGPEGGMHICAGWLAESLALVGRREEGLALLNDVVSLVGPTGTATEQFCPRDRIALGNIAQAYTYAAIINASVRLGA